LDERTRQRLQDIVEFDEELRQALSGTTSSQFAGDRQKQRVAERLLEIAGEAAVHVPEEDAAAIGGNWDGLRRMRILLAHAYHRTDVARLFHAATVSLPDLAVAVRKHLDEGLTRP
jgi:uncharacterized protein with HEPN domain